MPVDQNGSQSNAQQAAARVQAAASSALAAVAAARARDMQRRRQASRGGQGFVQQRQAMDRAAAWAAAQREYQRRAEEMRRRIQEMANKAAMERLRRQRNVDLLGLKRDGPLDFFPGTTGGAETTPATGWTGAQLGRNAREEGLMDWERAIQPRPGFSSFEEQGAYDRYRQGERDAQTFKPTPAQGAEMRNERQEADLPKGAPPKNAETATADRAYADYRRGERNLKPITAAEQERLFDASAFPGAWRLKQRLANIKDPEVLKYYDYLDQYNEDMRNGKLGVDPADAGADGDFGTTSSGNPWSITTSLGANAFPYVLVKDNATGKYSLTNVIAYYDQINQQAMTNPERAGEVMLTLAALGAYGDGSEKYVENRVQVVTGKDGKIRVLGTWGIDDAEALRKFLPQVSALQMSKAQTGDVEGIEQIMASEALKRQELVDTTATGGSDGSGGGRRYYGGGGGWGGGGGGGGYAQSIRLTDPELIGSTLDAFGRQRLGRSLTPEEKAAFVKHFHELERKSSAGYYAGGEFVSVDLEGQVESWLESRYGAEAATQNYGQLLMNFAQSFASGAGFGGTGVG